MEKFLPETLLFPQMQRISLLFWLLFLLFSSAFAKEKKAKASIKKNKTVHKYVYWSNCLRLKARQGKTCFSEVEFKWKSERCSNVCKSSFWCNCATRRRHSTEHFLDGESWNLNLEKKVSIIHISRISINVQPDYYLIHSMKQREKRFRNKQTTSFSWFKNLLSPPEMSAKILEDLFCDFILLSPLFFAWGFYFQLWWVIMKKLIRQHRQ